MNIYKYQFRVSKITLSEKNLSDDYKDSLIDEKLMSPIKKLIGLPITIILADPEEFPNEGTFFAKCQAEDKASEMVATLLGTTYGGRQIHQKNFIEDADIKGSFIQCELISIEQVV